jgi:thymidylate kinase
LIEEYRSLAHEFGFVTIDARRSIEDVQGELRTRILEYLRQTDNHPPDLTGTTL